MRKLQGLTALMMLGTAILSALGCVNCAWDHMVGNAIFDGVAAICCFLFALALERDLCRTPTAAKLPETKEKP